MNRKQDNDLSLALRDIASAGSILKPDYDRDAAAEREPVLAGPNDWDNLEASDWGPEHDFELYDHGTLWVFYPVSRAALQWCYRHLPEDCARWGGLGFVIEHRYIEDIVRGARRDNLMSEQDWIDGNNEADDLARQWEDQE